MPRQYTILSDEEVIKLMVLMRSDHRDSVSGALRSLVNKAYSKIDKAKRERLKDELREDGLI